jgi:hypothetical protein
MFEIDLDSVRCDVADVTEAIRVAEALGEDGWFDRREAPRRFATPFPFADGFRGGTGEV